MAARAMPAMRRSWTRWVGGRAAAAKSLFNSPCEAANATVSLPPPGRLGRMNAGSHLPMPTVRKHVCVHLKQDRKYDAVQPCEASHPMG